MAMVDTTFDLFISHAGRDKEQYINPLVRAIKEKGISAWYDKDMLTLGDSLVKEINEGLAHSRFVLLCLSENFISRSWSETEMATAMAMENTFGIKKVIPIILNSKEAVLTKYPLLIHKVRFSGNDFNQLADILFRLLTEPEDILGRSDLVIDAEVSDYLASFGSVGTNSLRVKKHLFDLLEKRHDDAERYWIYYTLGRLRGTDVYNKLRDSLHSETGIALNGVNAALNFFQ